MDRSSATAEEVKAGSLSLSLSTSYPLLTDGKQAWRESPKLKDRWPGNCRIDRTRVTTFDEVGGFSQRVSGEIRLFVIKVSEGRWGVETSQDERV